MEGQVVVKLEGDGEYPLDVDATLADLTGDETIMLEDYLGSWDKFGGNGIRSIIVTIWLAKRQAGKKVTLEEIAQTKGLVFGNVFDVAEATNGSPPSEAAEAAIRSTTATSEAIGAGDSRSASA